MHETKRYLVMSALPYANGPLHIGHLSGAYLSADIFTRYLRLMGKDVVYVCGSDEHGAAITLRAKKENITPQEIIDKYDAQFRDVFQKIGISCDIFHRTSSPLHHETSQDFFRILFQNNKFTKQTTEQYFDESAQQFLADRYIMGVCPKCANPDAYGDQCEKCGSTLNPTDLLNPRSVLSGEKPVLKSTTHWFLPLNEHEQWLREYIELGTVDGKPHHDPRDWKTHVVGQCKSWLDGGLQPRAMTRDLDWGVDVPQEIEGSKGKKLYVWMDAPIGYISATKQWAADHQKDWTDYWQNDETELINFIGKDNIVFHCLTFPAILKAHGGYNLPTNVPANQFMNLEGKKISTSRNWAVWVHEYLQDFDNQQDELRYNLIKNMPEQRDSEFTWKNFQETNNNELVNNIANFVNRVVVLTNKYYGGIVPDFDADQAFLSALDGEESYFDFEMTELHDKVEELCAALHGYEFRNGLKVLMEISSYGNQLLQSNEPWKKEKTDPELVQTVLGVSLQIVTVLSVACRPFLPFTSDKLRKLLNLPLLQEKGELELLLETLAEGQELIPNGHKIGEPDHLFSRIPDELIAAQVKKLEAAAAEIPQNINYEPLKATVDFDIFTKTDIRTGTIVAAEKVKGAKKLLHLTIDIGIEKRTVVSGIAEYFEPDKIIGQKILLVANLAPRTLKGIESNGMILMSSEPDGKLNFVSPPDFSSNGMVVK